MSDDWRHKECKKCKGELPTDVEQYSGVCCNCTWEETFGITWDEYIKEYNKKKHKEEGEKPKEEGGFRKWNKRLD